MRVPPASSSLFIRNRDRLRDLLPPGAICVVHSNDIMPTNADGEMGFRQCSDLYYLTGIDQEETVLMLFPDAGKEEQREVLFVRETNEKIALWEGRKLDRNEARELSGIKNVHWAVDFPGMFRNLMAQAKEVFLTTNEHSRATVSILGRNERFVKECKDQYPLHTYQRLAPLVYRLRMVKQPEEIAMLQKACELTSQSFRRVLKTAEVGMKEWELEAELLHEYVRSGSRGFAYPPIIASGANACVLHYVENSATLEDGQVVLMDVAAEWGNWNADLSRVIPANGKFTSRQREIYDAVLRVLRLCEEELRPGVLPKDLQKLTLSAMENELRSLGLIKEADQAEGMSVIDQVRKYFPHGVSHHLGLDVHDASIENIPFEVGNVVTLEPGIYIREEGVGIRLENDYVVQDGPPLNLLESAPIEAEEIERLMGER